MKGKMILLVEDSKKVQNYNKQMLNDEGFVVECALTLSAAKEFLSEHRPDAVILDVGMPDGSGLDFLRELRKISKVPVLILTGYNKSADIVRGFKSGCDDYLSKPYTFDVLLVRLQRLLQVAESLPEQITKASLRIDLLSGQAFLNGEDILLTQKEFSLLVLFIQNEGRCLSAEYIFEKVWGQQMNQNVGAVKHHVSDLRKKLEGSGYTVTSIRGAGYCFRGR